MTHTQPDQCARDLSVNWLLQSKQSLGMGTNMEMQKHTHTHASHIKPPPLTPPNLEQFRRKRRATVLRSRGKRADGVPFHLTVLTTRQKFRRRLLQTQNTTKEEEQNRGEMWGMSAPPSPTRVHQFEVVG